MALSVCQVGPKICREWTALFGVGWHVRRWFKKSELMIIKTIGF